MSLDKLSKVFSATWYKIHALKRVFYSISFHGLFFLMKLHQFKLSTIFYHHFCVKFKLFKLLVYIEQQMPFVFIDKKKIQPRFRSPTPNLRFALVNTPFHSRIKCSPDCLELNVKIKNGGAARCAGTPRKNCIYRSRENIDCHFLCVLSLFFPFCFSFLFLSLFSRPTLFSGRFIGERRKTLALAVPGCFTQVLSTLWNSNPRRIVPSVGIFFEPRRIAVKYPLKTDWVAKPNWMCHGKSLCRCTSLFLRSIPSPLQEDCLLCTLMGDSHVFIGRRAYF